MTYDVIIIGGGIVGLSCARQLAKAGLAVSVFERQACGQEASWAGAGILAPCSWHRRDDLARMHMDALFKYHTFAAQICDESGVDPQFSRCGALKLIRDDNRMKMARNEIVAIGDKTTPEGQPIAKTLSVSEAQALEPRLTTQMMGAQHCQMTAQIRNPRLLEGLRQSCLAAGVKLHEHEPAQALHRAGSAVVGIHSSVGEYQAAHTVLCAGAWSTLLDSDLERHLQVYPVRGQMLLLHKRPSPFTRVLEEGNFYMVARHDGHILVGATEEHHAGYNKRNTAQGLAYLTDMAVSFVPALADATVLRAWSGLRPGTPDRRPFIGAVPDAPGLIAATGHFRTGLSTAPVVSEIIRDLIVDGSCAYDLGKCSPGRSYPNSTIQHA